MQKGRLQNRRTILESVVVEEIEVHIEKMNLHNKLQRK